MVNSIESKDANEDEDESGEDYNSSRSSLVHRSKLWEDARPRPGQVLINNAMVHHEGLPTTKGTRYILVGFMNIDTKNPKMGCELVLHMAFIPMAECYFQRRVTKDYREVSGKCGDAESTSTSPSTSTSTNGTGWRNSRRGQ